MARIIRQPHTSFPSRVEHSAREEAPPRVSTILCLIVGGMTLLVLIGKAFTLLFAVS
ncbi:MULTISPECIES: hypothetical protein [unclassified Sinorhizobium]|uniref:hypothetical protein n=1 Tax=unclassified Sinorhizobium TaxID=2613772 RepID=UPI0024C3AB74|nr:MULTISPECIES: hypothetical protein [unclassified Sinorhizobium]MDK1377804.1 hypothetical protein [Sinorhizobium sp. 6-70]MDK1480150.1 hypothetical protein [Sinorhizobium sp. 6-117]